MQLFTEIHVGKAMPFLRSFSLLNTFCVSSSKSLSPYSQMVLTDVAGTHFNIISFNTPKNETTTKILRNWKLNNSNYL